MVSQKRLRLSKLSLHGISGLSQPLWMKLGSTEKHHRSTSTCHCIETQTDELQLCTFRFLLLATFDCVLYTFAVFFSRLANPLSLFLNILIMRRQTTNELYLAMIIECVPRREMTFTRHARYRYKIGNEHRRT